MAKKAGIFFRAVPDSGLVTGMVTGQNKINLGFPNCFIPSPRIEKLLAEATETLWFPIKQGAKITLPKQAWFVNFCADADEYAHAMSSLAEMAQLANAPVFNHPDGVMNSRRDRVSEVLQGINGLTAPKCIRFSPKLPQDFHDAFKAGALEYPVLVRPAASQSGTHLVKIDGPGDWDKIFAIPWGGQVIHMTQFVDFANEDGEYIKIRAVCAGDQVLIRHTLIAKDWLVHAMDRTDAIVDRQFELHRQLRESATFNAVVREAKHRIGLDFFGLDLGWRGPEDFVLFEANAAMSILSTAHMPTYRRPEYMKILKDIEEGVVRAIRAVQFQAGRKN